VTFSEAFGLLTVDEGEESESQRASEWGTFKGTGTVEVPAPEPVRYKSSFGLSVLSKAAAAAAAAVVRSEEVNGVISSDTAHSAAAVRGGGGGGGGGEGSKALSSAEQLLQHMREIREELLRSRPTAPAPAPAIALAAATAVPASAGDLVSALKALGYAQSSPSVPAVTVSDAVRQGVRDGLRQALSKQQSGQDRSLSLSDSSYSDSSAIDLRLRGRERGGVRAGDVSSSDKQKERQKERMYIKDARRREQHSGRAGGGVGTDGPGSLQAVGPTGLLHARGNGRGSDRETDYADGE
jgi:hypothetical protein